MGGPAINEAVNDVLPEPPGPGPPSFLRDARACRRVCEPRSCARAPQDEGGRSVARSFDRPLAEAHRSAGTHVGFHKHNRAAAQTSLRSLRKLDCVASRSTRQAEGGWCAKRKRRLYRI